jgi:hypothetical protein
MPQECSGHQARPIPRPPQKKQPPHARVTQEQLLYIKQLYATITHAANCAREYIGVDFKFIITPVNLFILYRESLMRYTW